MQHTPRSPGRALAWLIAGTTLLRLGFAAAVGLGVDESYMVTAGRVLSLGYFDHPPASWWLSWGAAHLAGTESAVVVRLPFIALFALSTWLMARLASAVADERAGFWAAVLLNLSPVFGITTGTWVLPDGPLDCALIAAALCLAHALPAQGSAAWRWWSGAGLCVGLALFSKYSAILTMAGAFAYLMFSARHRFWLRRPQPYCAAVLAGLVFSPVIIWNATHGWASFAFQGDRATGLRFRPLAPLETLGGEALFVLPWIWLPMMLLFARALRPAHPDWRDRLLACLAAPPVIGFALISAWSSRRILFHWAAPGYLMLFPLLGRAVAQHIHLPWVRRVIGGTAALAIAAVSVIGLQTRFDILGPVLTAVTRKDPTIEGVNWTSLRADLRQRGLLPPGAVVGVPNWRDAGKIGFGLGPDVTVLCLCRDARQFAFAHPPAAHVGQDMLLLSMDPPDRAAASFAPLFRTLTPLAPAPVMLRGRTLHQVSVLSGDTLLAWPPR
ncbi:MAG: glycosyltransferase family 39 protein [Acetobacteraceae bacterium]